MKILISGFKAFAGQAFNTSELLVKDLQIENAVKVILPVEYENSFNELKNQIDKHNPDFILAFGESSGRKRIEIERIALNIEDSILPDESGVVARARMINKKGPEAIFNSLPIDDWSEEISKHGFQVAVSNHAGAYVCNSLYYKILDSKKIPGLFVHVPSGFQEVDELCDSVLFLIKKIEVHLRS